MSGKAGTSSDGTAMPGARAHRPVQGAAAPGREGLGQQPEGDADPLHALVLDRLAGTDLAAEVAELLIAELDNTEPTSRSATGSAPTQAYLQSIVVEGFRGIGRRQELTLQPGPGLTLIVGRNGSGKSSFAEALEFALTGDSYRWRDRPAMWRDGWRNLHAPDPCSITVGLALDSVPGSTELVRTWAPDAELFDSTGSVQAPDGARYPLSMLGWDRALDLYRPFLSYAELGGLLNAKPTELHDAIQNLLGLDRLVRLEANLKASRKDLQDQLKQVADGRSQLRATLSRSSDPRAEQALSLLLERDPDDEALARLATGEAADAGTILQRLRRLAGLTVPAPDDVRERLDELRHARESLGSLAFGSADAAHRRARLLQAALEHHEQHGATPCPVCGQGRLDDDWTDAAAEELVRLQAEAREVERAEARLMRARRAVRELLAPAPAVLANGAGARPAAEPGRGEADPVLPGLPELRARWGEWSAPVREGAPTDDDALITHVETAHEPLLAATEAVRRQAAARLQAADDAWRPLARALAAWIELAASVEESEAKLRTVKAALSWLRKQAQVLRDERLAPFAGRSRAIWQELRQQSNVELGSLRLDGLGNRRQLRLDVAVDDVDTGGLGVMSQGELHALGLALFLPRATAAESPFRFVMIDDPVQAMDPWKVDGLAKVLAEVARTHQVVVFSHDDRLPEALRRLQLPATVVEVVRRENSELELRKVLDPIQLYLDDARAIAKTRRLTTATRGPVVAGLCRSAIEAACHRTIRRRALGLGASHAEVEERLAKATTLSQVAALCLFDDPSRTGDVPEALEGRAREAFRICDRAIHGLAEVEDPQRLIGAVRRLVNRIEAW